MAVYDSAKTREAAAQIKKLSECLDSGVRPGLQDVSGCIEELQGKTAQAMEEKLLQLLKAVSGLSQELEELGGRVYAYADLLEQTDAQMADGL